jgi:uncharacterized coiled-coil protein SlyX
MYNSNIKTQKTELSTRITAQNKNIEKLAAEITETKLAISNSKKFNEQKLNEMENSLKTDLDSKNKTLALLKARLETETLDLEKKRNENTHMTDHIKGLNSQKKAGDSSETKFRSNMNSELVLFSKNTQKLGEEMKRHTDQTVMTTLVTKKPK